MPVYSIPFIFATSDDSSHNNAKSLEIDKFKNQVYGSAGIKIARVIQKAYYDAKVLCILVTFNDLNRS